jgi:tetratricopeptide (TPR) repeat protein
MNVCILSRMPLCGIPFQLAQALNRHTDVHAHCVVLRGDYGGGLTFDVDLARDEMSTALFRDLLDRADVVHFFNYIDLDNRQYGVDFREALRGKRLCIQYHSQPEHIAQHSGRTDTTEVVAKDYTQILVTAEYLRLYDANISIPIPIIIPLDDDRFAVRRKWSEDDGKVHIAYSPAARTEAIPDWRIWTSKGYEATTRAMRRVAEDCPNVELHLIENTPHHECLRIKQRCDIAIDEVISGAYHTNSLETMAMGVATVCHIDQMTEEVNSRITGVPDHPWIDATRETLYEVLRQWSSDLPALRERQAETRRWMEHHWNERRLARLYRDLYDGMPRYEGTWSRERAVHATKQCCIKRPDLIRGAHNRLITKATEPAPVAHGEPLSPVPSRVLCYPINENHVAAFERLIPDLLAERPDLEIAYFVLAEAEAHRPRLTRALALTERTIHRVESARVAAFIEQHRPAVMVWSVGDADETKVRLLSALHTVGGRAIAIEEGNQLTLNAGELSYYALPFDVVCAASEPERTALVRSGYAEDQVVTTGAPAMEMTADRVRTVDPAAIRSRLGIPGDRRIGIYTASPLRRHQPSSFDTGADREAIVNMLRSVSRDDVHWIIKLHPAETAHDPTPTFEGVHLVGDEAEWPELLAIADVVVNRGNSQTALEALHIGVPAIITPLGRSTIFDTGYDTRLIARDPASFDSAVRTALDTPPDATVFLDVHRPVGSPMPRITDAILRALDEEPRPYSALDAFRAGVICLERANHAAARIHFTRGERLTGEMDAGRCTAMNDYLTHRRWRPDEAAAVLDAVMDQDEPPRELLIERMVTALRAGRPDRARIWLDHAREVAWSFGEREPYLPALRYAREAVRLGEPSASEVLDDAIETWPELVPALMLRLVSDWMIDDPADTDPLHVEHVRRVIAGLQLDPPILERHHVDLLDALQLDAMPAEALDRIVQGCPDLRWARFHLAKHRRGQDRHDDARDLLEDERRRFGESGRALVQLARVHRESGRINEALRTLTEAEQAEPGAEWLWCERGWCHEARGDHATALRCYEREDHLFPGKGWVVENIARVSAAANPQTPEEASIT